MLRGGLLSRANPGGAERKGIWEGTGWLRRWSQPSWALLPLGLLEPSLTLTLTLTPCPIRGHVQALPGSQSLLIPVPSALGSSA